MKPTIYLSNWSSHRTPGHHGPGRKVCAMIWPRSWEHGDGRCISACPSAADLDGARRGRITEAEYRRRCDKRWGSMILGPGKLMAGPFPGITNLFLVEDGDTLCCSCPRPDSPKRTHECHIEWLAPHLARAGWRVVLYGEVYELEASCVDA